MRAGSEKASTRPVSIKAMKAVETDDFKLKIDLSKSSCYVGEPVSVTVTWYMASDVQSPAFSLPFMKDMDWFYLVDPQVNTNSGKKYYRVPLGGDEVVAEAGQGALNGQVFTTLTFQKVLIPKKSGEYAIEPGTVSFQALVGYRRQQSPFGDELFSKFFNNDNFGFGKQGVYKQRVVPSNALKLIIRDLPVNGRPSDFSGLVGEYQIEAKADPTSVNVGDPITLTVGISGPEYLDPVELPPLSGQSDFANDFKIPPERATGEISGNKKVFTQTIRPMRAGITQIPPVQLSYFDTRSQSYKIVETQAIPLTVSPTRIITAMDAEGNTRPASQGSDVETWSGGIAHNYEDETVLDQQIHDPLAWLVSPRGMMIIAVPPFCYLLILSGYFFYRRKTSDPLATRSKKAASRLSKSLKSAKQAETPQYANVLILEALKTYLGDMLRIPSGALTFIDVNGFLLEKGADTETLNELKNLFSECEAARYGNSINGESTDQMIQKLIRVANKMEKICK
ncbi:MAG: BatD family protein [Desulfobacterales bacterium]|nr:BatD family protein [Desulfobacterales bacterium]